MNYVEKVRLSLDNIEYIGEGNSSIVLKIRDTNKVIRLKKSSIGENSSSDEIEYEKSVLQRDYIRVIIRPCFEKDIVIDIPEIIDIHKDFVTVLSKTIENHRPLFRIHKQVTCPLAFVYLNYAKPFTEDSKNPTLCIELKCKRGFMPRSLEVHGKCTFCLMQYLKLKKGKISSLSKYCPLELFSGNKNRMSTAIFGLFDNPQNNIKMFIDSKLIFSENIEISRCMREIESFFNTYNIDILKLLADVIINILLNDTKTIGETKDRKINDRTGVSCTTTSELKHGCILERILRLQKLGANVNIDAIQENDFNYLKSMIALNPLNVKNNDPRNICADDAVNLLEKELNDLQKHFVSATFSDCSIMIALKCCRNDLDRTSQQFSLSSVNYVYNVAVADLDAKPVSKLEYHKRIESEIINAYLKHAPM